MATTRTRLRRHQLFAALVSASLALTACGGGAGSDDDGIPVSSENFPVTINTAQGDITVDDKPERIVALTPRHQQLLSLVGEQPVGFGFAGYDDDQMITAFPWMEGTYVVEPEPELMSPNNDPNPEAIAALQPDLILTNIWAVDDQTYEQLSAIAPTYVGIDSETQTSWTDDLTALATLTGHDPAITDQAMTEFEDDLAAAADRLPGLQGASFQVAALAGEESLQLSDYGNEPLLGLGLVPGEGQPATGEDSVNAPTFSLENVDRLTADVLFVVAANRDPSGEIQARLESDPRVAELPSTQNGTLIYLTAEQWRAINGGFPASYLWWLDELMPELENSQLNQTGQ